MRYENFDCSRFRHVFDTKEISCVYFALTASRLFRGGHQPRRHHDFLADLTNTKHNRILTHEKV